MGGTEDLTGPQNWDWLDDGDDWVPPPVDVTKPSIARIYDYWLDGKDNYAVDREVADRIAQGDSGGRDGARANRRFLVEAVEAMAHAGIRQFVDLGSGIPTSPNVHETAWSLRPDAVVVYVDNDPVVLAHTRAATAGEKQVAVVDHDVREPATLLAHPRVRRLVDLSEPVGFLMISVLHFVDLSLASAVVSRYLRDAVPGSQIAISAASSHGADPEALAATKAAYTAAQLVFRTWAEFEALFDDVELVGPVTELQRFASGSSLAGIGRVTRSRAVHSR